MMALTGVGVWTYYQVRFAGLIDALRDALAENAKLKVAIDAAGKTDEARQICAVTLAALNAAYPKEPVSPMAMAEMKREDG